MPRLRTLLLGLLLCSALPALAKEETASAAHSKAHLSVELLGPGLFGSLNGAYRPIPQLAITSGVGYFAFDLGFVDISSINVPVFASLLLGGESHFLELAAGGILVFASSGDGSLSTSTSLQSNVKDTGVLGLVGLGYRYWPWDGGFHFRLTAYMFFRDVVAFWPGLTLGYAF